MSMMSGTVGAEGRKQIARRWRTKGVTALAYLAMAFVLGLAPAGGTLPAPAQETASGLALPETVLLSPAEVEQGLRPRLQQMQERYERRQQRRRRDEPRSYAVPEIDDVALPGEQPPLPLPPDAPGGEIDLERQEAER